MMKVSSRCCLIFTVNKCVIYILCLLEAEGKAEKLLNTRQDIANLYGIFGYIEKTTKRIGGHLQREMREEELQKKREAERRARQQNAAVRENSSLPDSCSSAYGSGDVDALGSEVSLHWDDYERMNDVERAQLLEQAIRVLTVDAGVPPIKNNKKKTKQKSRRKVSAYSSSSSSDSYSDYSR